MIRILESKQVGRLFARRAARLGEAEGVVRPILEDVRKRGDRALIEYARATQGNAIAHVTALAVEHASAYLSIDPATRRNLEISETIRGEPAPTLMSLFDTCATSMGSRLLLHTLHHPRRDQTPIRARLAAVAS